MGTPVVLIHGGAVAGSCWDLTVPHLSGEALAVDLPGRGRRPAPRQETTIDHAARAVLADVEAAGLDEVVVVGHSLAGSTMPRVLELLGDRVRHLVFVACTVPEHGTSSVDTIDPRVLSRLAARARGQDDPSGPSLFGRGLSHAQRDWLGERRVQEDTWLSRGAVDLRPLATSSVPRTWVRTLQDALIPPAKQLRFADNVGGCRIVDLDAGHLCMVTHPVELAGVLNEISDDPKRPPRAT